MSVILFQWSVHGKINQWHKSVRMFFFFVYVKILLTCYVITVKYTTYIVSKTIVLLFFFSNSSVTDFTWLTANSILYHLKY